MYSEIFSREICLIPEKKWFWHVDIELQGAYDKFPAFFHMGTFIDSTHMIL